MRTLSDTPDLPASLCPGAPGAGAATRVSQDPLALTRAGPPLSQRSPRNFPASAWSTAGSPTRSATPSLPAGCPWQPLGTPGGRQARGQGRSSARDPNAAPRPTPPPPSPRGTRRPSFPRRQVKARRRGSGPGVPATKRLGQEPRTPVPGVPRWPA